MPSFHSYQLKQSLEADGRRCQKSAQYIFSAYESEMKRKIGSVSLAAANDDEYEGASTAKENDVTNAELDQLREFVNICPPPANPPNAQSHQRQLLATNKEVDVCIKKLLSRLVPYSKPLNGTALHRAGEKKKLMVLLSSPVS